MYRLFRKRGASPCQNILVYFLILSILNTPLAFAGQGDAATRIVRDRTGRTVAIPQSPKRIACMFGASYEKLLALGGADRVVITPNVALPWNYEVNPGLKKIPVMGSATAPDVEELLGLKTDLVIYHPFARQIGQMAGAGLPVVVPYDGSQRQLTLDDFLQDCYGQIRFYGELLGGQAQDRARDYIAYADERIKKVTRITAQIPKAGRPKVFYFCGQVNGPAGTQTRYSTADWLVTAAGGTMLTHDEPAYFVSVTTEQMILWNPDIIVVSTLPSIGPVVNNPHWKNIRAVRENKVVMSPRGQFYWSHFSTESFLCILFLAKLFHPEKFQDLDLTRELMDYYEKFYRYPLTAAQARRILARKPPLDP